MIVDTAKEIKAAVSMIDVCRRYGIEVNHAGYAVCPFHGEKTGSLKVYPGSRGWHCFGCGEGGDVIDFVQRYFGLSLKEAEEKLNDDFGLGILMDATDYRTRMEAGRSAAARRKAEEAKRRKGEQIEKEFWEAYDLWWGYQQIIMNEHPKSPDDEPTNRFLTALAFVNEAEFRLDQAAARRLRWQQQKK